MRGGNQLGKTMCGGAEAAYHTTGEYPDGWAGRVWERPTVCFVGGVSGTQLRDNAQRMLMGRPGEDGQQWGTGMIPGDKILNVSRSTGTTDLLDTVQIRHRSGGVSTMIFKTYEQRRERWMGDTVDFVWFDEEPPPDIYAEGIARITATDGMVYVTFTPLLGMSEVVKKFLKDKGPDRHDTNLTIEDAIHIRPEDRAKIIAGYPPHEREARAHGVPLRGSGLIYPVAEETFRCEPFEIPRHWAQIGGMDFGWQHPFAAVRLAWDREADIVYVANAYRAKEQTPIIHSAAIKSWGGAGLPWAWPADGHQHEKGSGKELYPQYLDAGLNMLINHSTFEGGGVSVEAGLMLILERLQAQKLKVFSHLVDWFEEFRMYHRDKGRIVKDDDDLMDATRYGMMMLREAVSGAELAPSSAWAPSEAVEQTAHDDDYNPMDW